MDENKTTGTNPIVLLTPIQAATRLAKAPQYIYQMLRNAKVPGEHIEMVAKGDGTYRELLKESFFVWFESRAISAGRPATAKTSPVVVRQATVDELMVAMAVKLEATGNKKFAGLAEALKTACCSVIPAGPEQAPQGEEAATVI